MTMRLFPDDAMDCVVHDNSDEYVTRDHATDDDDAGDEEAGNVNLLHFQSNESEIEYVTWCRAILIWRWGWRWCQGCLDIEIIHDFIDVGGICN